MIYYADMQGGSGVRRFTPATTRELMALILDGWALVGLCADPFIRPVRFDPPELISRDFVRRERLDQIIRQQRQLREGKIS